MCIRDSCYDDRFRPYHGSDLERQIAAAECNAPRILANLPARLTYRDWNDDLQILICLLLHIFLTHPTEHPIKHQSLLLLSLIHI